MEILFIIGTLLIGYFVFAGKPSPRPRSSPPAPRPTPADKELARKDAVINENTEWLERRWKQAEQEQAAGQLKSVPNWFFDPVTDRQLERLRDEGLKLSGVLTKGKASDLIGLFEAPDEGDLEVLRFFKISTARMNETRARHEVQELLADPNKAESWNNRPATQIQKEFYRFFGFKVPKGLTKQEADQFITEHLDSLTWNEETEEEIDSAQAQRWEIFEDLWDELCDAELRADYEIKKPSMAAFRTAIKELEADGVDLLDIEGDIDTVIDKLIELNPSLSRETA